MESLQAIYLQDTAFHREHSMLITCYYWNGAGLMSKQDLRFPTLFLCTKSRFMSSDYLESQNSLAKSHKISISQNIKLESFRTSLNQSKGNSPNRLSNIICTL